MTVIPDLFWMKMDVATMTAFGRHIWRVLADAMQVFWTQKESHLEERVEARGIS